MNSESDSSLQCHQGKCEESITRLQLFVHHGVVFRTDSYVQIQLLFDRSGSQPQLAETWSWRANKETCAACAPRHCLCLIGGVLKGKTHTICKHNYDLKKQIFAIDRRSTVNHSLSHAAMTACLLFLIPTYLSRLESGWEEAPCPPLLPLPPVPDEPPPEPADCRFPDRSFSTAARFPVRAASRSSCSFPMANPTEFRGDAGKRREKGALGCREWNSSSPFPFSLSPRLPTSSYFSALLVRWRGNKSSLRPLAASLRIHGAAGAGGGGGKFLWAPRYRRRRHRANFLWPVPGVSSVTSSKLPSPASTIENPPDAARTRARTQTHH